MGNSFVDQNATPSNASCMMELYSHSSKERRPIGKAVRLSIIRGQERLERAVTTTEEETLRQLAGADPGLSVSPLYW